VVRAFDPPLSRYGPGHRGVDLAAPPGSTVLAAGSGVVTYAGALAGRGVLSIMHADGLRTTYEPVQPAVAAGARVAAGAVIGHLVAGHPGCPLPACLHFGLRRGADYLDPLDLFRRRPIRLLPLAAATPAPARPGGAGPAGPASDPARAAPAGDAAAGTGWPSQPAGDPPPSRAEAPPGWAATAQPARRRAAGTPAPARLAATAGLAFAVALLLGRRRPP
jgi:hypothetical protein